MFCWNSLAFSIIQQMLAIWSLVPLPFLNPAWTSGSSQFTYCWNLVWRIFHITLLATSKVELHFLVPLIRLPSHPSVSLASPLRLSPSSEASWFVNSFKLGFNSKWTENFQIYILGFEEAEEPKIKLPRFVRSWGKQGKFHRTSASASLTTLRPLTLWIKQTVENS